MQLCPARDLLVPDKFATIGEAIAAVASADDRVVVTDRGVYAESIRVERDLVLVSDPPGARIQPDTGADCVVIGPGASRVTIRGFVIGASEKTGILVDPGPESEGVRLELFGTTVIDCADNGVSIESGEGNHVVLGENTRLESNSPAGLNSAQLIALEATDVVFDGNEKAAVYMHCEPSKTPPEGPLLPFSFERCEVRGADHYAIDLAGSLPLAVAMKDCLMHEVWFGLYLVGTDGDGTTVELTDSRFTDIGYHAVTSQRPLKMTVTDCLFEKVVEDSITFARVPEEPKDYPRDAVTELTVSNTDFVESRRWAIAFRERMNYRAVVANCNFERCGTAIMLQQGFAFSAELEATDTRISASGGWGIAVSGPGRVLLDNCVLTDAGGGIGMGGGRYPPEVTPPVAVLEAVESEFVNSARGAIGVNEWSSVRIFLDGCSISGGGENALRVAPSDRTTATVVLENTRIHDIEGCGVVMDRRGKVAISGSEISRNGAEGIRMNPNEATTGAILCTIRDSSIQDNARDGLLVGPSISASLDIEGCEFSGNTIGVHAPRNLAGGVAARLHDLSGVNRERGALIDAPLVLTGASPAGPGAWRGYSRTALLDLQAPLFDVSSGQAADLFGAVLPPWSQALPAPEGVALPQASLDALPFDSTSPSAAGRFLMRAEEILATAGLARMYEAVGKKDLAHRFAGSAREALAAAGLEGAPERSSLDRAVAGVLDGIGAQADEANTAAAQSGSHPSYGQLEALGHVRRAVSGEQAAPPLPEGTTGQAVLDDLLQALLGDLVALAQPAAGDPDVFRAYATYFDRVLEMHFARTDRMQALEWLDGQTEEAQAAPSAVSMEYHDFMAHAYRKQEAPAREAAHLEALWDMVPARKEALAAEAGDDGESPALFRLGAQAEAARKRLSELYIDYWQVPDKAIALEREAAQRAGEGKGSLEARLEICKTLYKEKRYDEAAIEITQLLEDLPENYDANPIRSLLGLAYLGAGAGDNARNEFARVINEDQGEHREKCLYLMGYSYITEQEYEKAIKPFEDLVNLYPDGTYAGKAASFLEKLKGLETGN